MVRGQLLLRALAAALIGGLLIGACGSEDEPAGSGGEGGSAGAGGGVASGGAPGSEPYVAVCTSLCDAMIERGCDDETCAPSCENAHASAGVCLETLSAYVSCLDQNVADIPTCFDYPPACEAFYLDWSGCVAQQTGLCGPVKCDDVGMEACSCWSVCDAGQIRESCDIIDDGVFDCECLIDDEVVATCPSMPTQCAFFAGCCAAYI